MQIEEIINEYGSYVYNYAMKLACHPQKAEDIAQETFINAWSNIENLRDERAIKKWLRAICMNSFLMECRKDTAKAIELYEDISELEHEGKMLAVSIPEPYEEVMVGEAMRGIQNGCFYAMVRKLTLHQRIAFSLVDMFGLTIAEVAELLELSEGATKGLLHRARLNIESFFDGHCNLLDAKNPCSCQAWLSFRCSHEETQKKTRQTITTLEGREHSYKANPEIRAKVHYLYSNMPEARPSEEWFTRVVQALQ